MTPPRLFLALLLLATFAAAPLFAETLAEAKADFASADKQLNATYQKAKASLPEHVFSEVQREQREWLEYRDSRAEAAAAYDGGAVSGEETSNVEYWKALAELSRERVRILEGWMKQDSFAHEWEGVWVDGFGGFLSILETGPGEFAFAIEVVRGPTYHLGNLKGKAVWNGRTARFSVTPEGEDEETWLTFVKRGYKLELIGENTSYFHGARAYFDGDYLRLGELDDEARENILAPEEP